MKLLDRLAHFFGFRRLNQRSAAFPAASISRLTSTWQTDPGSINRQLRWELRIMRGHARQLARGDAYGKKFIKSCRNNIAGPDPFRFESKIRKPRGQLDKPTNDAMETAYEEWAKAKNCDVTGQMTLGEIHRLCVENMSRDGEFLLRLIFVDPSRNPWRFQLQVIDIDRLDEEKNDDLGARGAIKMGVQLDPFGKPVAYHILETHPSEIGMWGGSGAKRYVVVPADQIIHGFIREWPEQVRGIPWMHAGMVRLWNLGGFEDAAVIAARVGATQMGVITSPTGEADQLAQGTDAKGNPQIDAEPGTFPVLPPGYGMDPWNPKYPDAAVEPFIRTSLRGAASATGTAYHSLASDPSNVNYSTARVALLEERDMWMTIQDWYIEHVCRRIYDTWRSMAMGMLPADAWMDRYAAVQWQAKRWDWVDPHKDQQANTVALENKITSRTRICAERGENWEDILEELKQENELAAAAGIDLTFAPKPVAKPQIPEPHDGTPKPATAPRSIHRIA